MSIKIPIFKLDYDQKFISDMQDGVNKILKSPNILEGCQVEKFENSFSDLINCKYSIATSNCTTGLTLILKALGIKNKKIIIPGNTFFATGNAVINSGNIPEFIDINQETLSIDYNLLYSKLNNTENNTTDITDIGAVIIVHIGGIISYQIDKIKNLCEAKGIPLIEDAAHAHLTKIKIGDDVFQAGNIGIAASFSFFPTKVMTTAGGGMITTNNNSLYQRIKHLKNFGRENNILYTMSQEGLNSQVDEFKGLMGYLECSRSIQRINRRNKLLSIYRKVLNPNYYKLIEQDISNTEYGKNSNLDLQVDQFSCYKCILLTDINTEYISQECKNEGIQMTGRVYNCPIISQPPFQKYIKTIQDFKNTLDFSKKHICPPLYPELTDDEIVAVANLLNKIGDMYFEKINNGYILNVIGQVENIEKCGIDFEFIKFEDMIESTKKIHNQNTNNIIVKILACGICGSDCHYYSNGGLGSFKQKMPLNTGHEPVGEIVYVLDTQKHEMQNKFKIGDKVIIEPNNPCYQCDMCLKNKMNLCRCELFMGATTIGAFSSYVNCDQRQLVKLPDNFNLELGVLMEPFGIAVHCFENLGNDLNTLDTFTIIGAGCIGLCCAYYLKYKGVKNINIVDKLKYRVDFAKLFIPEINSYHLWNCINDTNLEIIKTDKQILLSDVVVDTAGNSDSFNLACYLANVCGVINIIGIPTTDYLNINPHKMRIKELKIQNIRRSNNTLDRCIEITNNILKEGKMKRLDCMVTHRFHISHINCAFELATNYKCGVIKTIIYH